MGFFERGQAISARACPTIRSSLRARALTKACSHLPIFCILIQQDRKIFENHFQAGEPSSETLLHVAAYHGSPQIRAVGHAHPINCTELAHRGIELDVTLAEEGVPVLGQPPLLDDQPKDQRARLWGESVASGTRAALLRQHGIVVAGTSVHDVLCKLELCEWIADLQLRLKR